MALAFYRRGVYFTFFHRDPAIVLSILYILCTIYISCAGTHRLIAGVLWKTLKYGQFNGQVQIPDDCRRVLVVALVMCCGGSQTQI